MKVPKYELKKVEWEKVRFPIPRRAQAAYHLVTPPIHVVDVTIGCTLDCWGNTYASKACRLSCEHTW